MESAIQFLSPDLVEYGDIEGLLSLCYSNLGKDRAAQLVPILQQIIRQFSEDKDIYQIHDLLGDVYLRQGQRENAMAAYQNAVTLNFDQHEIWDKILGIK